MIKFKISFIIALAVLAAADYFYGKQIINSLFLVFLSMLILSVISLFFLSKYIKIDFDFPNKKFFVNDNFKIYLKLQNKSIFFYPYVNFLFDFINTNKKFSLLPFNSIRVKLDCNLINRGIYTSENCFLDVMDIFLIASKKIIFNSKFTITVYPQNIKLPLKIKKTIDNTTDFSNDSINMYMPDTYSSIEKYTEGDSLKNIHWKVSAKRNNLYVKKFDTVKEQGIKIYMDMMNYNVSDENLVSFSLAIIKYLLWKEENVYLNIENLESFSFRLEKFEDYNLILSYYLKHKSSGKENFFDKVLKSELDNLDNNENYKFTYIITYGILPENIETVLKIKDSCQNLIIFTLKDASYKMKHILSNVGVNVIILG